MHRRRVVRQPPEGPPQRLDAVGLPGARVTQRRQRGSEIVEPRDGGVQLGQHSGPQRRIDAGRGRGEDEGRHGPSLPPDRVRYGQGPVRRPRPVESPFSPSTVQEARATPRSDARCAGTASTGRMDP
ncbi:hypothetical protein B7W94_05645 [Microbacterium sp. LEMMJ01]|nr:hypothetical protein B7W94_05645 [Microbacterium sp. LEMMJ01]